MKRIITLLLIAAAGFSSCNKDSDNTNTNLHVVPQEDSVSKGSYFKIKFQDPDHMNDSAKSFELYDLTLRNQAYISMSGYTLMTPPDSLYTAHILVSDHKATNISVDLSLFDSTKVMLGEYKIFNNLSTLTDYSSGENKTYSIGVGSIVNITHDGDDCLTGSFTLNLYYNHKSTPATGTFKIFH